MLDGHVDRISHGEVAGWAADNERPDETVEVSIFVDGNKRAQLGCDLARTDLREKGTWGDGRHGFRFGFPAALDRRLPHRVSVQFTTTGRALGRGEMQLSPDGAAVALPTRPSEEVEGTLGLPPPSTPRDMFRLLQFYDPTYGLSDLLARIDLAGRQPREVCYMVFGAMAAKANCEDSFAARYAPRDHLNQLLMSDLFQQEVITHLLNAFPKKRRLLFVHIPKCAGSDLSLHLMTRYPSVIQRWMEERWTSKDALFSALRELVSVLPLFDSIFVRGHISLDWYLDRDLVRPIDRLFTIIRHPIDIAVSQANYVMMRIAEDIKYGTVGPDTREWLTFLGLDDIPRLPVAELADYICRRVLRTREIAIGNSLCHWLGGGDAEAVLDRLAESGAEVTVTSRYNRWLQETWGIGSSSNHNESRKFIRQEMLDRDELDYLNRISAEDARLFELVQQRLAGLGTNWLTGSQLRPPGG